MEKALSRNFSIQSGSSLALLMVRTVSSVKPTPVLKSEWSGIVKPKRSV